MDVKLETAAEGIRFYVKVIPASSRTVIAGTLEGMLKIKVAAPPEKGKANRCLVEYIATILGVRKNQVTILSGAASPVKQVQIEGISLEEIQQILAKTSREI